MWKVVGIGLLLLAGQASGSEAVGCKARLQAVNDQLVFAKAHNNAGQTAGLEQAARNIKANCPDEEMRHSPPQRVNKNDSCKARLQAVNDQLVFAKAHNNTGEIAGLESAARNIKTYCTD
ncbi:MAG: DUF1090 family protein [Aeromonas sobria]